MTKKLTILLLLLSVLPINAHASANYGTLGGVGDSFFDDNPTTFEQVISVFSEHATYNITNGGVEETDSAGYKSTVSAVPLPAAAWLFGSAVLGFVGYSVRRRV